MKIKDIDIFRDKYLRSIFGLSLTTLIVSFVIGYFNFNKIDTPLIIHFDAYRGIDFLGEKTKILGFLISALVMILINMYLSDFLYRRERFLSYVFAFVSLIISILILIALGVIISVN